MIYTNDETDKSARQKNFLLYVWVLPIVVAIAGAALLYYLPLYFKLNSIDSISGLFMGPAIAVLLYAKNRPQWLKMPDGTYFNTSAIPARKINLNEPAVYDQEFFFSQKAKLVFLVMGIMFIGINTFVIIKLHLVIFPLVMLIAAVFFIIKGVKELKDKSAKLKVARKGIWTKKLGFVDWQDVAKTEVRIEKSRDKQQSQQLYLDIYIKGSAYNAASQPDDRINLTQLTDGEMAETVIDTLKNQAASSIEQ